MYIIDFNKELIDHWISIYLSKVIEKVLHV